MLEAFSFMHQFGLAHRGFEGVELLCMNLKEDKVMQSTVKIADFGIFEENSRTSFRGKLTLLLSLLFSLRELLQVLILTFIMYLLLQ